MADLDMTTAASALCTPSNLSDMAVTLSPRRIYEVRNVGTQLIYYSTDGSAVDADGSQALHKGVILIGPTDKADYKVRLAGVTTLKLKSTTGASLAVITFVGTL